MLDWIRPHFASITMEVQALEQADYERLIGRGLNSVLIYQETYNSHTYNSYHPKGRKSNTLACRLETPTGWDAPGSTTLVLRHCWTGGLAVSSGLWRCIRLSRAPLLAQRCLYFLPRLRPAAGCQPPNVIVSDRNFVQLICAYRIGTTKTWRSLPRARARHFAIICSNWASLR